MPSRRYFRQVFAGLLVVIGFCLLIGVIDFSPNDVWLPILLALTGILIVSTPETMSQTAGIVVFLLGIYLFFRATDMITVPVLRYVFGGLLLSLGTVNLIRNLKGDDVPLTKTFSEKK